MTGGRLGRSGDRVRGGQKGPVGKGVVGQGGLGVAGSVGWGRLGWGQGLGERRTGRAGKEVGDGG